MTPTVFTFYRTGQEYIDMYETMLRDKETRLANARKILEGFQEIRGVGHPRDANQVRFVQKLESEVYWTRRALNAARRILE